MGLLALLHKDSAFSHRVYFWWCKGATSFSAA